MLRCSIVFFSDETWFHLDGYINTQNYCIREFEEPSHFFEQHCCIPKKLAFVATWLLQMRSGINFLFVEIITAEVYYDIIQQFIAFLHKDERDAVFQRDNARPHVAKGTTSFSSEFFGEWICEWPPRSPDLSPLDFFLWSYLKYIVNNGVLRNMANTIRDSHTLCVGQYLQTCWKGLLCVRQMREVISNTYCDLIVLFLLKYKLFSQLSYY